MPAPIEIPNDLISLIGQQVCRKARNQQGSVLEVDSVIKSFSSDNFGGWNVHMERLDGKKINIDLANFYELWEIRK